MIGELRVESGLGGQLADFRGVRGVYGLLKRTKEAGSREILTVAAQDEFVAPSQIFAPEAI